MTNYQYEPLPRSLLVEDHLISRRYMSEALRRNGWAVKHCGSAEEALLRYRTWNPRLVITDLNLPGANGIELAEKLAQCASNNGQSITILLVSAQTSPALEQRARSAGIDGVLRKPLELKQFRKLLCGLTANRKHRVNGNERDTGQTEPLPHTDEDLLHLFRAELQDRLPELENHLLCGCLEEAESVIHQLTASAAICGHQALEIRLREFDAACRQQADVSHLASAFSRFHRCARSVLEYPLAPGSG